MRESGQRAVKEQQREIRLLLTSVKLTLTDPCCLLLPLFIYICSPSLKVVSDPIRGETLAADGSAGNQFGRRCNTAAEDDEDGDSSLVHSSLYQLVAELRVAGVKRWVRLGDTLAKSTVHYRSKNLLQSHSPTDDLDQRSAGQFGLGPTFL